MENTNSQILYSILKFVNKVYCDIDVFQCGKAVTQKKPSYTTQPLNNQSSVNITKKITALLLILIMHHNSARNCSYICEFIDNDSKCSPDVKIILFEGQKNTETDGIQLLQTTGKEIEKYLAIIIHVAFYCHLIQKLIRELSKKDVRI